MYDMSGKWGESFRSRNYLQSLRLKLTTEAGWPMRMRMVLILTALLLPVFATGCLGGRAAASNDGGRADLMVGRSF